MKVRRGAGRRFFAASATIQRRGEAAQHKKGQGFVFYRREFRSRSDLNQLNGLNYLNDWNHI
jgi:hypothetical protein